LNRRSCVPSILIACLLLIGSCSFAVAQNAKPSVPELEISTRSDSRFLPYEAVPIWSNQLPGTRYLLRRPAHLWTPAADSGEQAIVIMAHNPSLEIDQPSTVNWYYMPSYRVFDESPVPYRIADLGVVRYRDGDLWAVGCGVKDDSAFLFQLQPHQTDDRRLFLATGDDITGNGYWDGQLSLNRVADVDRDGRLEALLFVTAGRDFYPRVLICVDLEQDRIEWRLPVASNVSAPIVPLTTADRPAIAFVTSCPGQGAVDTAFSDLYSYLVVADAATGVIVRKWIVGRYPLPATIFADSAAEAIFVSHTLAPTGDTSTANAAQIVWSLSILTAQGDLRPDAIGTEAQTLGGWTQDYDGDSIADLYLLVKHAGLSRLLVFDRDLRPLARSGQTRIIGRIGVGPPVGASPHTLVLREEGFVTGLYSPRLEKLAHIDHPVQILPLQDPPDPDNQLLLASVGQEQNWVLRLQERGLVDYALVLYLDYRAYILGALVSLLIGLGVMNFYRLRARRNLATIASQKEQLEEAHRQLREAQDQLITAAKFEQAQTIAGGFAHEIRNALLPAEIAHRRLRKQVASDLVMVKRAEQAVDRALDLVNKVSVYTNIKKAESLRPIRVQKLFHEVLAADAVRLESTGVAVESIIDADLAVAMDREHLRLILANLLSNAADAAGKQAGGQIWVSVVERDDGIEMRVTDTGPGLSDPELRRLLDPFVSDKPRNGHGLGLALVNRIISVYGGTIRSEREASDRSAVIVNLTADVVRLSDGSATYSPRSA